MRFATFFIISFVSLSSALSAPPPTFCIADVQPALSPRDPLGVSKYYGIFCSDGDSIVRSVPSLNTEGGRQLRKTIEIGALQELSKDLRLLQTIRADIGAGRIRPMKLYSNQAVTAEICLVGVKADAPKGVTSILGCTAEARLQKTFSPLQSDERASEDVLSDNGFQFVGAVDMPTYYFFKVQDRIIKIFVRK